MSLFGIYKGIEHDDSMEHGQWTNMIGHENLETIEKRNSLDKPKLCLGMVSLLSCYGTEPTSGMLMTISRDSLPGLQ